MNAHRPNRLLPVLACLIIAMSLRADQTQDEALARIDQQIADLKRRIADEPDRPTNISLDVRIAVLLGHGEHPRPAEAFEQYVYISKHYKHADYYRDMPDLEGVSLQTAVPDAALSAIRFTKDVDRRRELSQFAIECMAQTWYRRRGAWLASAAREPDSAFWQDHRRRAMEGDVLVPAELHTLITAVDRYAETYPATQVRRALDQLIARYVDTAVAQIAERHIYPIGLDAEEWGEPYEGVRLRIVGTVVAPNPADPPMIHLQLENQSKRAFEFDDPPSTWMIEVDGRRYAWVGVIPENRATGRTLAPGKQIDEILLSLSDIDRGAPGGWRWVNDGSPLILSGGSHTFRVWARLKSVDKENRRPAHPRSNYVTINVRSPQT